MSKVVRNKNLFHLVFQILKYVFVICFFNVAGCSSTKPVVKIGLVAPFEGRNRLIGYDVIYSARLAIREINEAGGIGNYRIGLVAVDDFGTPELATSAAKSMVSDPGVIAVIGHWQPDTTKIGSIIYSQEGMPFIAAGMDPIGISDPSNLPDSFKNAYGRVTPFDETPGPYAGTAYDAVYLLFAAMEDVVNAGYDLERSNLQHTLKELTLDGITGLVFQP
jgi:ABC-type branched-subunit amino acid transport system substrate-binding protein